jgi:hypothetical protein
MDHKEGPTSQILKTLLYKYTEFDHWGGGEWY